MVMLAFVVLGAVQLPAAAVDQFPNIDFPTVVVVMDYPGASPEIVESEVTKKVEEAVNTVAGINALNSRSYEGTSVVIIEFNLDVDGRKAAEDVREKVALIRPLLRDEVKEPRVSRFDPPSVPIFNVAVLSHRRQARRAQELTTWADQVLQKRLENVRGVGSVSVVGGIEREINLYLSRPRWRRWASASTRCVAAVRSENQELPVGAIRSLRAGTRGADRRAPEAARGLRRHRRRARAAARRSGCGRWPTSSTARRKSRAWRSTTASARCCCRCRSRRTRTPSRWSTACYKALAGAKPLHAAGRQARGQPRQLAPDPRLGRQRASAR